jgi:hypothetical protein
VLRRREELHLGRHAPKELKRWIGRTRLWEAQREGLLGGNFAELARL